MVKRFHAKLSKNGIVSIIENFAIATGRKIIPYTKMIDKGLPPTELSQWMDSVSGFGHRVKHGHDFLANIGDIYKKFGTQGVFKYPVGGEILVTSKFTKL